MADVEDSRPQAPCHCRANAWNSLSTLLCSVVWSGMDFLLLRWILSDFESTDNRGCDWCGMLGRLPLMVIFFPAVDPVSFPT
jgi:hypothetical protein